MLKVFLVEDEIVVRESLRDNFPWGDYGYEFAGEAGDGEMALPEIRKIKPDVIITDIRMPFMDGLSLCHILKQEMPQIHIIIMSGFDDFEYARRAITEGVDRYLSKPVTRKDMKEALEELRQKIETDREQQSFIDQYQLESREYEQFQRRKFLESVFGGKLSVEKIYEEAGRLNLDVSASCCNLILYCVSGCEQNGTGEETSEIKNTEADLAGYFLRFKEYILSRWNMNAYCVIVRGDRDTVIDYTRRGVDKVTEICGSLGKDSCWYVTAGTPVERFSQLRECFDGANHAFSRRYWRPEEHVLEQILSEPDTADKERDTLQNLDAASVDPAILERFLSSGQMNEVEGFTDSFLESLGDVLKSKLFRNYLMLSVRFAAMQSAASSGVPNEQFMEGLPEIAGKLELETGEMKEYTETLLKAAISVRDKKTNIQGNQVLKDAIKYIEEHYTDEQISLNSVASSVGVSGSYLSSLFSREMNQTFVEYVTGKKMEKARQLLREEQVHTAEAAAAVGYRDPHYFSFVFRRTQGCTPREYRNDNAK
ncbi:MAG: response regulator [Lachnospiraceae bacterium]|jgi:two-component system response regulator YesN|nr:response regulator [Lachnospiraceae bacterium]NLC74872.1 response regulator [Clostridiales bacterium]